MTPALALAAFTLGAGLPGGTVLGEHLPNLLERVKVGEWVTYRFDDGAGRETYWRVAIVGEEVDALGRPAVWVELDVGTHHAMAAPLAQLKVLAARSLGMTPKGISRVFAAYGLERPREVAVGELAHRLGGEGNRRKEAAADLATRRGAPTRLMTAGGTVLASPIEVRLRDTVLKRYWLCDTIPILRLVKIEFPAVQHAMEVRDWGLDATPQMALPEPGAATIRMEGPK